jgi:predicted RND superfamily exporter protein
MSKHLNLDGVRFELTGTPVVAYRGINRVTEDLRSSLLFAFLIVASVIAIVFRSVSTALISLIPNGIPLLIGYGSLGLLDYRLDPTAALIFTVGFGIAVDDTIHLLARFREERDRGIPLEDALVTSVSKSGRAILVTTIILVIGIGVNLLSAFAPIQAMALAGVTIVSAAFICDVTILPVLLKLTSRDQTLSKYV